MTKTEIVDKIAAQIKTTKAAAAQAFDIVFDSIKEALSKGGKVSFIGFGTFSVAQRKAKAGRNPQTGKPIKIPAKKVAKFSAGKNLKDVVNGKAKMKAKTTSKAKPKVKKK